MGTVIADLTERLVRIGNDRRTFIRPHRSDPLHHIGDLLRVGDNHLFRFLAAQVPELRQHFLRRPKIKWSLIVRIGKAAAGHDDPPVNFILRIQEMNVAGSDHRLLELLAQADDPLVDLNEVLFIPHAQLLVSNHEAVVPQRLNFQIIVKIHQSDDLFLRSFFPDCLIKLSGLAGGTDE